MIIILLSGGSGKRLWPLSNDVRSKQFLKLFSAPNGNPESMIQRVVRQIIESGIADSILIATGESQIDQIKNQLSSGVNVVAEPSRRDTFPAIALACSYLIDKSVNDDEIIVVMPCDTFTESSYFRTIRDISKVVEQNLADIVLMGITPTCASSKYGYILPQLTSTYDEFFKVSSFVEKPTTSIAKKLVASHAFWNGGVFSFKLGYIKKIIERYIANSTYENLRKNFDKLPKISFDYEVVEKAKSIAMIPFNGLWKDLGTWDALSVHLPSDKTGNVLNAPNVKNTHIINELDLPIICVGLENLIVSASPDGILIADKSSSEGIKEYVSLIHSRPMYEDRRWGFYKVLGHTEYPDGLKSLTKLLHLNAGGSISYQIHAKRDEVWTFIDGEALLVIDDSIQKVVRGDVISIKAGQKHAVKAITTVEIIEVQMGTILIEEDIERLEWRWV